MNITGRVLSALLLAAVLAGAAWGMIAFFRGIDPQLIESRSLAIDWQQLHNGLLGGDLHYDRSIGLWNPPWSMIPMLPLGWLSMRDSWAILTLFTLIALIASVPRRAPRLRYYAAIFLLVLSFPALRHAVDGNFEGLVIAGVTLILAGQTAAQRAGLTHTSSADGDSVEHARVIGLLALGMLLASAKPQLTFLFFALLGPALLLTWRRGPLLALTGVVTGIVGLALLWRGADWLAVAFGLVERGSLVDVSLSAALTRLGLPGPLVALLWGLLLVATLWIALDGRGWRRGLTQMPREKAGLMLAAGLLLSPYSAGNSVLTVLAIGVIPLFLRRPWIGLALIALINATIVVNTPQMLGVQAYYTTGMLLVCWGALGWFTWRLARDYESVTSGHKSATRAGSSAADSA